MSTGPGQAAGTGNTARRRSLRSRLCGWLPRNRLARRVQGEVDAPFYESCYASIMGPSDDAAEHFVRVGAGRGYLPNPVFDPLVYALKAGNVDPSDALAHALKTSSAPCRTGDGWAPPPPPLDLHGLTATGNFDLMQDDEVAANRAAARGYARASCIDLNGPTRSFRVTAPSADAFLADLEACRPLVFTKLPHGYWDARRLLDGLTQSLGVLPGAGRLTANQRNLLAQRWARRLFPANGVFSEHFVNDMEQTLRDMPSGEGYRVGVGFKGYPTHDERVWHTPMDGADELRARLADLEAYFADGTEFLDGTVFKRWAISGDLQRFAALLRARRVILVASDRFTDLDDRLGLANLERVAIPPANGHVHRHAILRDCRRRLSRASAVRAPAVLLIQAGGSLSFWLLTRLAREFPEATLLDMGQALNIWVLDRSPPTNWLRIYIREILENGNLGPFYRKLGGESLIARFSP